MGNYTNYTNYTNVITIRFVGLFQTTLKLHSNYTLWEISGAL